MTKELHNLHDKHKISIIVPAYNIEAFLERCVESILNQTYSNLEIIIVNDGSTDGTANILESLRMKDDRVCVIHKENGGVTSARLTGVKAATGEWIGFVDGDDYIDANMYERLLKNAMQYHADISHCGYQMVFPNRIDYYYNTKHLVEQDQINGLKDLLKGVFVEPGLWNKLYRKSMFCSLLQDDKIPLDIKINEDFLMNYWLFKESKLAIYEDICPYHYIVRSGSAANSPVNVHKLLDPIKVMKIILEDVKGNTELETVVWSKLIRQYINLATMPYDNSKDIIQPHKLTAQKELKALRSFVLKEKGFNFYLKVMALWVSAFPKSYEWVHKVYSRLSGHYKKYSIEG